MTKQKISYSEAVSEIEEILNQIENGELDVDELTEKVKRVTMLIKICKTKLKSTEEELKSILGEKDMEEENV
jgi:exodeoxyribonuclease VII small subunit